MQPSSHRRLALLILAGGVCLYIFGHIIWVMLKWTVIGCVALLVAGIMYRRFKQVLFRDFFEQSLKIVRPKQKEIERYVGGPIELPSIGEVRFVMGKERGPLGDVPRRAVSYSFNVNAPSTLGVLEVKGMENEEGKILTHAIWLDLLRRDENGVIPERIDLFQQEKKSVIEGDVLEGEVIDDKTKK